MEYAIGIDLGGTAIKSGLVDKTGKVLFEDTRPTRMPGQYPTQSAGHSGGKVDPGSRARNEVLDNIKSSLLKALEKAKDLRYEVKGIGIGAPGIITDGRVTACAGNVPEVEGLPLGQLLEGESGLRAFLANDANLMGLAEARFGAAAGKQEVIFLTIGTGIGGALIIRGELYSGNRNQGGELGHILVKSDGRPCSCGSRGCLEAQASIPALIEDYRQLAPGLSPARSLDGRKILALYEENDPAALAAMDLHFDYLATGIAGLINIFSPENVIIGGGISESGSFYAREIGRRALAKAMKETSADTLIQPARLGNKAGFIGAAAFVFENA
jgi:glucokinase